MSDLPRIADLERRVSNSVVFGVVSQVDHKKYRYRVKFGDIESDWIPKTETRAGKTKTYDSYEVGEQVVMASQSGDLSQAVIIGAVATDKTQAADEGNIHRTVYPDGTVVEYDHKAKSMKTAIAEGGSFDISIGGGASIVASGGDLKIKAPGNIGFESATLTHNDVDISDKHKHTEVLRGGDLTGPPAGG